MLAVPKLECQSARKETPCEKYLSWLKKLASPSSWSNRNREHQNDHAESRSPKLRPFALKTRKFPIIHRRFVGHFDLDHARQHAFMRLRTRAPRDRRFPPRHAGAAYASTSNAAPPTFENHLGKAASSVLQEACHIISPCGRFRQLRIAPRECSRRTFGRYGVCAPSQCRWL